MKFRRVELDGKVVGYVRNDARGTKIADDFLMEHVSDGLGATTPVDRIPQKAHRLDADDRSAGRSYR